MNAATHQMAQEVFKGFTDAEVVLVTLALNSGARFRADLLGAGLAITMTALAVDLVMHELRRRELDPGSLASGLMARLLERLPQEGVSSD